MSDVVVTPAINAHQAMQSENETKEVAAPAALEPAPAPAQDDKFAPKFAALSRKEKEMRLERQKLENERKSWEAEKLQTQEKYKSYDSIDELLKTNPLKFLTDKGITYEQLTQQVLNDQNPTAEMMIRNLESKLEKKYEDKLLVLQRQIEEKEVRQAAEELEQQKAAYRESINEFVTKNDKYEMIRLNDAQDTVFNVILEHYEQTKVDGEPRVMDISEAADAVEAYLEEQANNLVEKSTKLKARLQPGNPQNKPESSNRQQQNTLSNAQAAQAVTTGQRNLSSDESKAEAAKLLRWVE